MTKNFHLWKSDFLKMLMDRYKHGRVVPMPPPIAAATQKYMDGCDLLNEFIRDYLEKGAGNPPWIGYDEIRREFNGTYTKSE